jgi:hypothetical protein
MTRARVGRGQNSVALEQLEHVVGAEREHRVAAPASNVAEGVIEESLADAEIRARDCPSLRVRQRDLRYSCKSAFSRASSPRRRNRS